jgi:DNA polymerase III delta prime subunit
MAEIMLEGILSKAVIKAIEEVVKKLALQAREEIALKEAIRKAYDDLWNKSEELGLSRDIFSHHLDKPLFVSPEFVEELWSKFFDRNSSAEQPDLKKLYEIYCKTFTKDWIPEEAFEMAFDYFWSHFLVEAKGSPALSEKYKDRIIFSLDGYVSPQDVRDYTEQYCKGMLDHLEGEFEKRLCFKNEDVRNYRYVEPAIELVLRNGERQPVNDIRGEILSLDKTRIVFYGDAGVGKTTFMRFLEKEFIRRNVLALYIHASEIEFATLDHLKGLIKTKLDRGLRYANHSITEPRMNSLTEYLLKYRKIAFIIDAYDQTEESKVSVANRMIRESIGNCPFIVSTRPYSLKYLIKNVEGLQPAEIKKFDKERLREYFGDKYEEAADLTKVSEELINIPHGIYFEIHFDGLQVLKGLINVPLLAKLIKSMLLDGKTQMIRNRTELFENFIKYLIDKQIENDMAGGITRDEFEYDEMLECLAELSLKLLRKGVKEKFHKEDVRKFRSYLTLMQKTQMLSMIKHVLDVESDRWFREDAYSYHHPNFQEYFAAKQMLELTKIENKNELFESMADMKYEPEVGRFFCELVEKGVDRNSAEEVFQFWQKTLFETESDWVRTYALQVRDKLGETKAKDALDQIFAEENKRLRGKETTDKMIAIPAGKFLMGSYEYMDKWLLGWVDLDGCSCEYKYEWPVRWVELDEYEIDKYPVTNEEYCNFLNKRNPDEKTLHNMD